MPATFTWDDVDEIAAALYESYSETDPLNVSFPRLHQMITGLAGFHDNPDATNEHMLERIQLAWYELAS